MSLERARELFNEPGISMELWEQARSVLLGNMRPTVRDVYDRIRDDDSRGHFLSKCAEIEAAFHAKTHRDYVMRKRVL